MVEQVPEPIELRLLQSQGCCRMVCGLFLDGSVHPLMASVLLWPTWLDALMHDAHLHPYQL